MKLSKNAIKWLVIIGLSIVAVTINSVCAKAEGEPLRGIATAEPSYTEEPEPTPAPTPDLWEQWQYPDWMYTEYDFTTPAPSSPPADFSPPVVTDSDLSFQFFPSNWAYRSYLNAWSSFLYNGDSSVWYFKSFTNSQIAVSSTSSQRPYYPWRDTVGYKQYASNNNLLNFYNGSNTLTALTSSNSLFDASVSDYNFSLFDVCVATVSTTQNAIDPSSHIYYFFALNKIYPKFYNSPSWFPEAGITETLLYDLTVYPSVKIILFDGMPYSLNLDPVSLKELYAGCTFDIDLSRLFMGSSSRVKELRFNFNIPFMSGSWSGIELYRSYLKEHPEITGHVPFYIYFDSSTASEASGLGSFVFARYYSVSEKVDNRNWLSKLLLPDMDDLTGLFASELDDISNSGAVGFFTSLKSRILLMLETDAREFSITFPSFSIPINGSTYRLWDSYTYNFSQTIEAVGLRQPIRYVFNILVTCLFVNANLSMLVSWYRLHHTDGVSK